MMAFTQALFYPWIDINDEGWLKNAVLYWDNISTIVPASIEKPYSTRTAEFFYDNGLLEPLSVEPDMREVKGLASDVLTYLDSPEGVEILAGKPSRYGYIHPDKLPHEVKELLIHPDKLDYRIQDMFASRCVGEWIRADVRFLNFYMTLLATRLAENRGLGLLTDTPVSDRLANTAKLNANISILGLERNRHRRRRLIRPPWEDEDLLGAKYPNTLAQGVMANLILKTLRIYHDTPAEKILKFKKKHSDQLGLLRNIIGELTSSISDEQPIESLLQQVNDKYTNEFLPQFNDFKKSLKGSGIKTVAENIFKASFISATATSVPVALIGLTVPQALLVGVGISLTASAILYNHDKGEKLRQSPFSYLLAAEKSFQ